ADRVHPVDRTHDRLDRVHVQLRDGGQAFERRAVEEVEVPREVVSAPVACAEDCEVRGRGIVGDDDDASAGFEEAAHGAKDTGRIVHVLDGGDQENEVV